LTGCTDYIAKLKQLRKRPTNRLRTKQIFAQPNLHRPAPVTQSNKYQLPDVPQQHNPAGTSGALTLVAILISALDIAGTLGPVISAAVRVDAQLLNARQLLLPLPFKLVLSEAEGPALPFWALRFARTPAPRKISSSIFRLCQIRTSIQKKLTADNAEKIKTKKLQSGKSVGHRFAGTQIRG